MKFDLLSAIDIDTNEVQSLCSQLLTSRERNSFALFNDTADGFCVNGLALSNCSIGDDINDLNDRRFCPCSIGKLTITSHIIAHCL